MKAMDNMLTFIYLAYQMMALLYETVAVFEDSKDIIQFLQSLVFDMYCQNQ
jgi:hypothetical protein